MSIIDDSRRRFLKQTLAGIGALTAAAESGFRGKAFAAAPPRRHLINIVVEEGWDSAWFHNAFPRADLGSAPADVRTSFRYTTRGALGTHRSGKSIGYLMRTLFTDEDLDSIMIWRGLSPAGSHKLGNLLLQHGSPSQYALAYSSLVSQRLALDQIRPLHYVKVAGAPTSLYTNMGLATGVAIPICIGDFASFRKLTTSSPSDAIGGRRGLIDAAVDKLTRAVAVNAVTLKKSREIYQSFYTNYSNAISVGASGLADKPEFKNTWKRYCLACCDALKTAFGSSAQVVNPAAIGADSERTGTIAASVLGASGGLSASELDAAIAALNAIDNVTTHIQDWPASGLWDTIKSSAFSGAMAEFVVRKNLAAVAELGLPCFDAHDFNDQMAVYLTITFAVYRELVRGLKAAPLDDGSGKSVLDATSIVMHTEFDREPYLSVAEIPNYRRPGTNHGPSASVLIAGGGFKAGQIIGDVKDAPGAYGIYRDFGGVGYAWPVRINVSTGEIDKNGQVPDTRSLLPTIVAAFGADLPPNQITDYVAIRGVIK